MQVRPRGGGKLSEHSWAGKVENPGALLRCSRIQRGLQGEAGSARDLGVRSSIPGDPEAETGSQARPTGGRKPIDRNS